jgi:hypothetical protein
VTYLLGWHHSHYPNGQLDVHHIWMIVGFLMCSGGLIFPEVGIMIKLSAIFTQKNEPLTPFSVKGGGGQSFDVHVTSTYYLSYTEKNLYHLSGFSPIVFQPEKKRAKSGFCSRYYHEKSRSKQVF